MTYGIVGLFLLVLSIKFYRHRSLFKQLSKREWLQYVSVFFVAWSGAVLVIVGGMYLAARVQNAWLNKAIDIVLILVGLMLASAVMHKAVPAKLRRFYS